MEDVLLYQRDLGGEIFGEIFCEALMIETLDVKIAIKLSSEVLFELDQYPRLTDQFHREISTIVEDFKSRIIDTCENVDASLVALKNKLNENANFNHEEEKEKVTSRLVVGINRLKEVQEERIKSAGEDIWENFVRMQSEDKWHYRYFVLSTVTNVAFIAGGFVGVALAATTGIGVIGVIATVRNIAKLGESLNKYYETAQGARDRLMQNMDKLFDRLKEDQQAAREEFELKKLIYLPKQQIIEEVKAEMDAYEAQLLKISELIEQKEEQLVNKRNELIFYKSANGDAEQIANIIRGLNSEILLLTSTIKQGKLVFKQVRKSLTASEKKLNKLEKELSKIKDFKLLRTSNFTIEEMKSAALKSLTGISIDGHMTLDQFSPDIRELEAKVRGIDITTTNLSRYIPILLDGLAKLQADPDGNGSELEQIVSSVSKELGSKIRGKFDNLESKAEELNDRVITKTIKLDNEVSELRESIDLIKLGLDILKNEQSTFSAIASKFISSSGQLALTIAGGVEFFSVAKEAGTTIMAVGFAAMDIRNTLTQASILEDQMTPAFFASANLDAIQNRSRSGALSVDIEPTETVVQLIVN